MSSESNPRWWLAVNGKAEGPFTMEEISLRLRSGQIAASTPACAEGMTEWKPIASWPDLATTIPRANSPIGPPPAPPPFPNAAPSAAPHSSASEPVLTNPLLPQMANWICIYSIGISPALWFFQHMLCCIDGTFADNSDFAALNILLQGVDTLKSFAVTILLFVGGARLRRLRASGASLIRIGLWIGLVGGTVLVALGLFGGFVLAMSSDVGETAQASPEDAAAALVQAAQIFVGFCEMLFMIFSLIWLTRHQRELPLTSGA